MSVEVQTQVSSDKVRPTATEEAKKSSVTETQAPPVDEVRPTVTEEVKKSSVTETQAPPVDEEVKEKKNPTKMTEAERRRADLSRRMEEASARQQKGKFMTPERKKQLKLLLRKKAAEELKVEQERRAEERKLMIEERCGEQDDIQWLEEEEELIELCESYYQRILDIESEKWDLERNIRKQHFEIDELNNKVHDLGGKFQKPKLKKVFKYGNKYGLLQRKAEEFQSRSQLRILSQRHVKDDGKKNQRTDKNPENKEIKETEVEERKNEEPSEVDEEKRVQDLSAGDVETSLEHGEGLSDGESRREDGAEAVPRGEEGIHMEGEAENNKEIRLEGAENEESRLDMPEFSEEQVPPPEPALTINTEDDLWLYLRDNVSAVHPSTVEEFIQNLIGTLQHIPEECLKPVIEANIKHDNPPGSDGEHLTTPVDEAANNVGPLEGDNLSSVEPQGGEHQTTPVPVGEEANNVEPLGGDNHSSVEPPDTSEGIFTSANEEVLSQFPGVSEPNTGIP